MTHVIAVDSVSKRFLLGGQRAGDLREKFSNRFRAQGPQKEDFWALKDVSFNLEPGNALGIVGHNGSGKSTMLKLLTKIMQPTKGTITTQGRMGALIEVGAGFHPDLTGRENVYLNGSILGLSRVEIARKFDDIVSFAGLERFIDTPVKRYSSGMYMRLGFSIAAHIDADILLVDEVLAVGDTFFQNKCMRRMKEFVAQGGTLVFVSHAMMQVAELCRQCVWLDHGELVYHGKTEDVVEGYLSMVARREEEEHRRAHPEEWAAMEAELLLAEEERLRAEEEQRAIAAKQLESGPSLNPERSRLLGITLLDADRKRKTHFEAGEALQAQIHYRFTRPLTNPAFCLDIFRSDGLHMFTTSNYDHQIRLEGLPTEGHVTLDIGFLSLNEGTYYLGLKLFSDWNEDDWESCLEDVIENALEITVEAGRMAHGCTFVPVRWKTASLPGAALSGQF